MISTHTMDIDFNRTLVYVKPSLILKTFNRTLYHQDAAIFESRFWTSAALVFLTFSSVSSNFMVIFTILAKPHLRRSQFNLLLLNLCFVCVCESLFNMIPAVLYTLKGRFGALSCRINAFTTQMTMMEFTLAFCSLWLERGDTFWSSRSIKRPTPATFFRHYTSILLQWLIALVFALPALVGMFDVKFYPERHCCSISRGSRCFSSVYSAWCHGILFLICILCIITIGLKFLFRKKTKKNLTTMEIYFEDTFYWNEVKKTKFVAVLMVVYFILFFPYLLQDQLSQACLKTSSKAFIRKPKLDLKFETKSKFESLFTWGKFFFVWVIPLLILWLRKEIRYKLMSLFCCRNKAISSSEWQIMGPPVSSGYVALSAPALFTYKRKKQLDILDFFSKLKNQNKKLFGFKEIGCKEAPFGYRFFPHSLQENPIVLFKETESSFIQDTLEDELNASDIDRRDVPMAETLRPTWDRNHCSGENVLFRRQAKGEQTRKGSFTDSDSSVRDSETLSCSSFDEWSRDFTISNKKYQSPKLIKRKDKSARRRTSFCATKINIAFSGKKRKPRCLFKSRKSTPRLSFSITTKRVKFY